MTSTTDVAAPAPARTPRSRRLAGTGLAAALAASAATALAAALARAGGVDLVVSNGETVPVSGVAVVTGFFSLVGVALAAALLRWSGRPAERFAQAAVALTAVSLVPPVLSEADPATTVTLLGLHLVAAAVMIPALTRALRRPGGR